MVLLDVASRFARSHAIVLWAFHVHHGLSVHADAWVDFCRAQADAQGARFDMRAVQVRADDARGVEEAARVARYAALGQMCRAHGVPLLLAAHHRDDQAETVLLQLMRGAGAAGLSGMAALQAVHPLLGEGVMLGRPLLGIARAELEQAASAAGLDFVSDESNLDRRYRRNALRHDIMPMLDQHFPGFAALVARSATHMQASQHLLHELAQLDMAACVAPCADTGRTSLAVAALASLSSRRADNLLRDWLHGHGASVPSTARLAEIRSQMLDADSDTQPFFDFADLTLHRIDGRLELHARLGVPPEDPVTLSWDGEAVLEVPAWQGRLIFEPTAGPGLSVQRLSATLALHPRVGQERLKLAHNRPSKSLKSLFQEAGVSSWKRKWSPLLYLGDDLVFVAGIGVDSRHLEAGPAMLVRWEATRR